jgi:hypothetical protein
MPSFGYPINQAPIEVSSFGMRLRNLQTGANQINILPRCFDFVLGRRILHYCQKVNGGL